jgi:hypothetical protein
MFLLLAYFLYYTKLEAYYMNFCPATFRYQKLSKQLTGLSKFQANGCLPTDIRSLL